MGDVAPMKLVAKNWPEPVQSGAVPLQGEAGSERAAAALVCQSVDSKRV